MAVRSLVRRIRDVLVEPLERRLQDVERSLLAIDQDLRLGLETRAQHYDDPRCLTRYGYKNFSQFDEDGVIDEMVRRVSAPGRTFVEFGVGNGLENNTMALLLQGWRGLWIEASAESCTQIRSEFREPLESGQLTLLEAFITAENIDGLFRQAGVPLEPDVLSIDIDGNDYWIWKALGSYRPRIIVIEYNASLGRSTRLVQPYDPASRWDESAIFGASLGALEDLGATSGYALVGCSPAGVNAFFVRTDLMGDRFLPPYTAANHYKPPRFGPRGGGHKPRWGRLIAP